MNGGYNVYGGGGGYTKPGGYGLGGYGSGYGAPLPTGSSGGYVGALQVGPRSPWGNSNSGYGLPGSPASGYGGGTGGVVDMVVQGGILVIQHSLTMVILVTIVVAMVLSALLEVII